METKLQNIANRLPLCGTHQFWVMSDKNIVISDGKHEIQIAPN